VNRSDKHMKFWTATTLLALGIVFSVSVWAPELLAAVTQIDRRTFTSHVDGSEDTFGLITPKGLKPNEPTTLIVYLHGMGSNIFEPFMFPNDVSVTEALHKAYPRFVFISCSYGREASWGIDAAMRDITSNIDEISHDYNVQNIIMVGSSMGGCTVLIYAATAPEEVKKKLIGVLSVESAGDLRELYYHTGYAEVQPTMEKAFKGTPKERPEIYRRKSFLRNIPLLDPKLRIFLVSARQDTTVPPHMQKELYNALLLRDYQVKLQVIDGAHGVPPATNYVDGIAYILNQPVPCAAQPPDVGHNTKEVTKPGSKAAPGKSSSSKINSASTKTAPTKSASGKPVSIKTPPPSKTTPKIDWPHE
jgi:dienelactone hydrolase